MSMATIEQIRAALVRGNDGVGRPYPSEARRAVLALVERREREGIGLTRTAAELGMSATTLRNWQRQRLAPPRTPAAGFCEVEILAAPTTTPASALVVHGPAGLRIEGATIADIAELIRSLR